jgi:hypothetical protein
MTVALSLRERTAKARSVALSLRERRASWAFLSRSERATHHAERGGGLAGSILNES